MLLGKKRERERDFVSKHIKKKQITKIQQKNDKQLNNLLLLFIVLYFVLCNSITFNIEKL